LGLSLLAGGLAAAADSAGNSIQQPSAQKRFVRTYKASAYVSLFSIPLLSRSDVGGGFAIVQESAGAASHTVKLQFLSGSTPERAHGLNRLGFIEENVEQRDREAPVVEYFGFMTASGEESLSEAKAALASNPRDSVMYVAAEGSATGNATRYSVRHILLPASYRWSDSDKLLTGIQPYFHTADARYQERHIAESEHVGTFLFSVRQAILSVRGETDARFVHNGKTFHLHTTKVNDAKAGEELRRAGLVASASTVMRLKGAIQGDNSNKETEFQLWFDAASANPLPLRFEFRPKSYLKLVFQAQ